MLDNDGPWAIIPGQLLLLLAAKLEPSQSDMYAHGHQVGIVIGSTRARPVRALEALCCSKETRLEFSESSLTTLVS